MGHDFGTNLKIGLESYAIRGAYQIEEYELTTVGRFFELLAPGPAPRHREAHDVEEGEP